MPTKRTRVTRNPGQRISDTAVELYAKRCYLSLHRELRLAPWQCSPLDVDSDVCPYPPGTGGHESWPKAKKLRAELSRRLLARKPKNAL